MIAMPRSDAVRVHAFEFGSAFGGAAPGSGPRFHDLRMTANFPPCAVRHVRLGGLGVRRDDLWRLLNPASSDGAVLVWPASPAEEAVSFASGPGEPEDDRAMRVISLIRVTCPDARAARRRALLNVRSIAIAEDDWQQHAPRLLMQAPELLRSDFDAIFHSDVPRLQLADSCAANPCAARPDAIMHSMTGRRPMQLGSETIGSEAEFWMLTAHALALSPAAVRGQVCLASGLAEPFFPASICYLPGRTMADFDASEGAPVKADDTAHPSAACASFMRLLDASQPCGETADLDDLRLALSEQDGERDRLLGEIKARCGIRAEGIARQIHAIGAGQDRAGSPQDLAVLEGVARIALRLPVDGSCATWRETLLRDCEDRLARGLATNGFLTPRELMSIRMSPVLSALVRHIVEKRPHAIVARLQAGLTMLAHCTSYPADLLDSCMRTLLPARWPASEWLALFNEDWAIRRALVMLRRESAQLPRDEAASLESDLVNRLSCTAFAARRSDRRRTGREVRAMSSGMMPSSA